MDFSDKYILMCKKAEEIQLNWKTKAFDIYQDKARIIRVVAEDYGCEFRSEGINKYGWEKKVIWIFRQDRLQEMVKDNFGNLHGLSYGFYAWQARENLDMLLKQFNSMEQLWLAFVMNEKYSKQWSEEKQDWITIREKI